MYRSALLSCTCNYMCEYIYIFWLTLLWTMLSEMSTNLEYNLHHGMIPNDWPYTNVYSFSWRKRPITNHHQHRNPIQCSLLQWRHHHHHRNANQYYLFQWRRRIRCLGSRANYKSFYFHLIYLLAIIYNTLNIYYLFTSFLYYITDL